MATAKKTVKKLTEREDFIRRVVTASVVAEAPITKAKATALANELWSMGPSSQRLAERLCNENMSEETSARVNKRDDEMDAKVVAIGKALGLKAYRQGDPRGWTIRVVVGPALANNFDGETVGCG